MTLLSKKENNNVKKSAIAREGKVLEFNLRNEFMKHCILCDESRIKAFLLKIDYTERVKFQLDNFSEFTQDKIRAA